MTLEALGMDACALLSRFALISAALISLAACGAGTSTSLPGSPPTPVSPVTTTGTLHITAFPLPPGYGIPNVITVGSDGALWFSVLGQNKVGRITTGGVLTTFPLPSGSEAWGITSGPDGALWFTELPFSLNKIGRITTAGVVTEYGGLTAQSAPLGIVAGPDGALWFTESNSSKIGRITTQGTISEFALGSSELPSDIVVGPDGALWFTEFTGVGIGRITTSGAITQFPDNILKQGNHESFALGQDGAFWFTASPVGGNGYLGGYLGRMTISGTYSEYLVPEVDAINEPRRIVSGSDGALWFLIATPTSQIGRMTTAGALTLYPLPANTSTYNMVVGPDGALWITESEQG